MGGHLLSDVATEEVRRRERLVAIDDEAMLICPWASRSPFELRIVPRSPAPAFERDDRGTSMIATALQALGAAFETPPQLNLWVRTAPRGVDEFCWHIDIVPRLTIRAGFELGAGIDVNIYPPERAAADLRTALGDSGCPGPMPPVSRPYPRFIADAAQEKQPYGRFAERLAEAFAKACEPYAEEAGAAVDTESIKWFPERG